MLVCPRITDFIWRLNSCPLPLVARRFPQVPAHPSAASPGSAKAALGIAKSKYNVAGLGKLKATALGWIIRGCGPWNMTMDHGSWFTDHGCSERPRQEQRRTGTALATLLASLS